MAGGIFISYRREDSANAAGRIFDHLSARFGREQVFMDVDGIEPGLDFHDVLNARVEGCDALIAVIGKDWTSATDAKGRRRIDLDSDFVQIEIAAALERNVRVIPVLVDGADMPAAEDLPDRLKPLARRNAFEVSHTRFAAEMQLLSDSLSRLVTSASPAAPSTGPVAAPARSPGAAMSVDAIRAAVQPWHDGKQVFVAPAIPPARETNIRNMAQIPPAESCIALIDFTVLGNAKDAMAMTDQGLRIHHSQETLRVLNIPFAELRDGQIAKTGWWHFTVGARVVCSAGGPAIDTMLGIMLALQAELKKS